MSISILIDWISATDKKQHRVKSSSHSALHNGNWIEVKGKNGYDLAQKHETGLVEYQNLKRHDMGKHVVMSGKTLQRIQEIYMISPQDILQFHSSQGHNITRLDVAVDFKDYNLEVADFVDAFNKGNVKTKLRKATLVQSLVGEGDTFYLGSMKKRKNLVRVYDKARELGIGGDWIRVELQVMGKKATSTALQISQDDSIETSILEIIKGVVDFNTVPVWDLLMHNQLSVSMASVKKTQGDTEKWLIKQCVPALARTLELDADFWVHFGTELQNRLSDETKAKIERLSGS